MSVLSCFSHFSESNQWKSYFSSTRVISCLWCYRDSFRRWSITVFPTDSDSGSEEESSEESEETSSGSGGSSSGSEKSSSESESEQRQKKKTKKMPQRKRKPAASDR